MMVHVARGGLFPCVGLAAAGDAVRIVPQLIWPLDEDTHMSVDSMEEEWLRLHDIRLNGQVRICLAFEIVFALAVLLLSFGFLAS